MVDDNEIKRKVIELEKQTRAEDILTSVKCYWGQFFAFGLIAGVAQSEGEIHFIPISWNEWVIGIAVLVGLMVLMHIPVVKYFTAVALSLDYGYSGYLLFGIFADIFFK
jgi:hypothetical protein